MPVPDSERLRCNITLRIECELGGLVGERAEGYPVAVVQGHTLSQVGTELQRQVYESLRIAYGDLLAKRAIQQGSK